MTNHFTRGVYQVTKCFARRPLSVRERAHFSHRLALFLRSGVPILTALTYIAADARRPHTQRMFSHIATAVAEGTSLAGALNRHAYAFPPSDIAFIRIGEESGRLYENLAYAAELIERRRALRAKVIGALIYPLLILIATSGIVLFLILYAFPKILPLFRGLEGSLPLSTRVLMSVTTVITEHGFALLAGIAALSCAGAVLMRNIRIKRIWHRWKLSLPAVGQLLRDYQLAAITQALATLLKSGIGIIPALELVAESTSHETYRLALVYAKREAMRGRKVSDALRAYPFLFPSLATQIIGTGEITGNLAESLAQVAHIYEDDVRERSEKITTLVEPICMIGTGIVVGFVALSIITPIYRLTQNLAP